jgi:solute carrier family 34 (sodium-dependent phosphate cotransporter)
VENDMNEPLKTAGSKKADMIKKIISLAILLWFFLLSIKLLGEVFKHFFSEQAQNLIANATDDPFVSLFIGILATAIIQSSSSVTSIIVAFVASGSMTYMNAIPMVLGANIGTSVTGVIVAFGQVRNKLEFKRSFSAAIVHDFFNLFGVIIFLPLEIYTHVLSGSAKFLTDILIGKSAVTFDSPLDALVKSASRWIELSVAGFFGCVSEGHCQYNGWLLAVMIVISLSILFTSLIYISAIMKKILIGNFEKIIHKYIFNQTWSAFLFGLTFTLLVQSSSVTISLIVPLVGAGLFTLEQIFPYAVGANIGTTITGILASVVTGNANAITIALVHTIFNTFNAIIFLPLRMIPISAAKWFSDKAYKNRLWAVGFTVVVFFVIPIIIIFI